MEKIKVTLTKSLIGCKSCYSKLRNLSLFISENCSINIVIANICRKDNISNIDLGIKRTCCSCVDNVSHAKYIYKDLNADTSINLTDTTANNNYVYSSKCSLKKLHRSLLDGICNLHLLF